MKCIQKFGWMSLVKQPLGRPKSRWKDEMGVREIGCQKVDRTGSGLCPGLDVLKSSILVLERLLISCYFWSQDFHKRLLHSGMLRCVILVDIALIMESVSISVMSVSIYQNTLYPFVLAVRT